MKLEKIANAYPVLKKLLDMPLSIATVYNLDRLMRTLLPDIEFFENRRAELLSKFGEPVGSGQYHIPVDKQETFLKEYRALLDVETETAAEPVRIPISEKITISYNEFHALEGLVELENQ